MALAKLNFGNFIAIRHTCAYILLADIKFGKFLKFSKLPNKYVLCHKINGTVQCYE